MGELFPFCGWQVIITFSPVFTDQGRSVEIFRYGSFPNKWRLRRWLKNFMECFQKEFEDEAEIIECPCGEPAINPFDPRVPNFFTSLDPLICAQNTLDQMIISGSRAYPENVEGPFLWEVVMFFHGAGDDEPIVLPVVVGPFAEKKDIPRWSTVFLKEVMEKISNFPGMELEEPLETICLERSYIFSEGEEEFLAKATDDPMEVARKFSIYVRKTLLVFKNIKA
jgi:hypothetical protein